MGDQNRWSAVNGGYLFYMGIFNFTIAGPQIVSGFVAGGILKYFFHEQAIFIIVLCGISMVLGAVSVAFVKSTIKEYWIDFRN